MLDAALQGYYAFQTKLENLKVFLADLFFVFHDSQENSNRKFNITDLPVWNAMKRFDDLEHLPVWVDGFRLSKIASINQKTIFLHVLSLKVRKKAKENSINCMLVKLRVILKLHDLRF